MINAVTDIIRNYEQATIILYNIIFFTAVKVQNHF